MKNKFHIASLFLFVALTGCLGDAPADPAMGGVISKAVGGKYNVVVRYRDGEIVRAEASLKNATKGTKATPSIKASYTFNITGCGDPDVLQPSSLQPAVLMADDAYTAQQEPDCPIYFGSMENSWKIN